MPPLPSPWRRLLTATALTPALLGAAAATADAAELSGTVVHVIRSGDKSTMYLATKPSSIVRLRGTEKQLKPVTRGRRVTVTADDGRVKRLTATPGFAGTLLMAGDADRRDGALFYDLGGTFELRSKSGDRITRGTTVVHPAKVGDGADLVVTWKLSATNGAVLQTDVALTTAGSSTAPAPAPAPAPPTSTPTPAPQVPTPTPAPPAIPAPTAPAPTPAPPVVTPTPAPPVSTPTPAPAVGAVKTVAVTGKSTREIYHAPQTPGYSSWAGLWLSADSKSVFTSFVQVTGTPNATTFVGSPSWTGVTMTSEIRRSTDSGTSWKPYRSDAFAGSPHALSGQATTALKDGTIIRRVNAEDQQAVGVPEKGTAYVQRLTPGSTRWSAPQYLLDPAKFTYQLTRIQYLSDGRLVATGNYWEVPAGTRSGKVAFEKQGWLLMVSSDEGRTWTRALTEPAEDLRVPPNEWDVAELPSGDLLAVMRTYDKANRSNQYRRQAVLRRAGAGWVMETPKVTPFPHSGHPELLTTKEGVVLHMATTGTHWTADGGKTWTALGIRSAAYYPVSVQAADGTIYAVSHRGGDNDLGEKDQAIMLDKFKLAVTR